MQAVDNPIALELADEVRKAVAPNGFVNDTLNRKNELEQLRDYMKQREQKVEAVGMEKMIIAAYRSNATHEVIETMREASGITEDRLSILKKQANIV